MNTLFTYKGRFSTFMQSDVDMLKDRSNVVMFKFKELKRFKHITEFLRQLWHLIRFRYDVYFCYFADYHAFLPCLFAMIVRKESIVIVAGYDAMGISSKKWKYGIFISPMWRQWIARAVYKLAKNILVVSGGLIQDLQKNGINITDKFHVVYFGYDVSKFNVKTKKKYILTVGVAKDQANYYRKGYDRFFKIASALPDFTFMAVGLQYKPDDFQLPDNVLIEPEMHNEGVRSLMAQAQCYMQLSRAEGLCNSVAEAMLSGCHVITSDCQGMAELNPGGNIYTNDENIIYAILNIMRYPGHRERNRDFIIKNFTLSTRARIINRLLKNT